MSAESARKAFSPFIGKRLHVPRLALLTLDRVLGVPYFLFIENQTLSITLACVVIVIGLAFVLSVAMMGNPYREMKNERLLFDPAYYSELNASYQAQKKTSLACIILMIVLISAAGILGLAELSTFPVPEIQCVLTAAPLTCLSMS